MENELRIEILSDGISISIQSKNFRLSHGAVVTTAGFDLKDTRAIYAFLDKLDELETLLLTKYGVK